MDTYFLVSKIELYRKTIRLYSTYYINKSI